jgi:hypothetical protein
MFIEFFRQGHDGILGNFSAKGMMVYWEIFPPGA